MACVFEQQLDTLFVKTIENPEFKAAVFFQNPDTWQVMMHGFDERKKLVHMNLLTKKVPPYGKEHHTFPLEFMLGKCKRNKALTTLHNIVQLRALKCKAVKHGGGVLKMGWGIGRGNVSARAGNEDGSCDDMGEGAAGEGGSFGDVESSNDDLTGSSIVSESSFDVPSTAANLSKKGRGGKTVAASSSSSSRGDKRKALAGPPVDSTAKDDVVKGTPRPRKTAAAADGVALFPAPQQGGSKAARDAPAATPTKNTKRKLRKIDSPPTKSARVNTMKISDLSEEQLLFYEVCQNSCTQNRERTICCVQLTFCLCAIFV